MFFHILQHQYATSGKEIPPPIKISDFFLFFFLSVNLLEIIMSQKVHEKEDKTLEVRLKYH